ncbi:MAG: hypothetical protein E6Q35_02305 [Chryseobacterium cucumeris]|nr:MAG: hypothetical protein E6Q35_02305 [Chryseobacterium cucumeris]
MAKKEEIKDPAGVNVPAETKEPTADPFEQFEKLVSESILNNMDDARQLFGKFKDRMTQNAEKPHLWPSTVSLIAKDLIRFVKEH